MEKFNRPHYSIDDVKQLIQDGKYRITEKARDTIATDLGMTESEAIQVVMSLTMRDFFKSMTVKNNNRMWQDVYKAERDMDEQGILHIYIKLQIDDGNSIVISFKSDEGYGNNERT